MFGMMKREQVQKPGDIEALLPWLVTGQLAVGDERRVKAAISQQRALARDCAAARAECKEVVLLNESLGVPSLRPMHDLFKTIDAERFVPATGGRMMSASHAADDSMVGRVVSVLLSTKVLAWAAAAGLAALLVQVIVMGTKIL